MLQELLEGYPIHKIPFAVHVPMNPEGVVPEGAFAGVPRLRHVSVESGIRLIGPDAWHSCRQLRIVRLPATVLGISDNAFRSCKLLNSVTAPGCREFGYKAFDECYCTGCIPPREFPTSLAAPPSLAITSFEAVSTLLILPCERFPPQASCPRPPLSATWHQAASALQGQLHSHSRRISLS